jgi:hypothetical protein
MATPRDLSRKSDGRGGAFIAHAHRRPWTDYQRAAADLLGERLPSGAYAYPVGVVLLPRQCGKTTFAFDLAMGRCILEPDYRAAYTAQTGHITTERMSERMSELTSTALATAVGTRKSQGTERMTFRRGSFLKAFPPKDGALRGSALDLVIVDEAQEIDETLGRALDQTIMPTFQTRRRRQLILVGTAGTTRSDYLRRYLDLARAGTQGVALIEYGFDLDADPTDPETWRAYHPGLAAGLADEDGLRTALAVMGPAGFSREYGNIWTTTADTVIPAGVWTAASVPLAVPGDGTVVLGVDVAVDRSRSTLAACWLSATGQVVVEIITARSGVSWVAPAARDILRAGQASSIVATADGPVATVVDALTRYGITVGTLTSREYTAACASFYDSILDRRVFHRSEPDLDLAVAGATRKPVGDGWGWGRRTSASEVSPLVAASLAAWGHDHRPPLAIPPAVVVGVPDEAPARLTGRRTRKVPA